MVYYCPQMKLPVNVEGYLHAAGRTGRLGKNGTVISLISEKEQFVVRRYSNVIGKEFKLSTLSEISKRKKAEE